MSLISANANQRAQVRKRTGRDFQNKPIHAAATTIKVRKEPTFGKVRTATGADVSTETYYLTEAVITTEDLVDGAPVRRVKDLIAKNGKRIGCEFWT